MKSKLIALTFLLSLLFNSCNLVDDLLTFTISNQTTIVIKSTLPVNIPSGIDTPDVTTNSSSEFNNNNTRADLVKNVKLKSLQLTITNPEGQTFKFLKEIRLFISTNDSDEIELAYKTDINTTTNQIDLICTDARLDKYIKSDKYRIRTQVTLKETVTNDVTVKADMKFRVTADPF